MADGPPRPAGNLRSGQLSSKGRGVVSSAGRAVVAAVLTSLIALGLLACDGAEDEPAKARLGASGSTKPRPVTRSGGVSAELPAGWHLLRKPITGVIYPVQALAVASYPVELGKRPPGCHPGRLLDQKPPGGVLVEVIEWTEHDGQPNLGDFPPRERPFRLPQRAYASHECTGLGYNVSFRAHGRRFQAFVMLDRERVDPRVRRETIELLSSMRFANPQADRQVRREVIDGARRDFQAATDDPPGFADCFLARFGRELTREELRRLIALRAARGEPAAARVLNRLGVEAGDVCGGRRWVPQLTEAASGLGAG